MKTLFLILLSALVMDASTILNAVETALGTPIKNAKGTLVIAETLEDAIELLQVLPDGFRVVLTMDGDDSPENINPAGLVTGKMIAYVQAPKGMEVPRRSLSHANRRDGTPSFLTRKDWLIRQIRGLTLVHPEIDRVPNCFNYKSSQWFKIENLPAFRTLACTFEITYALDGPANGADGLSEVVLPIAFQITGITDDSYLIGWNGKDYGEIQRFESIEGDTAGVLSGFAIVDSTDEAYIIAHNGSAHGRMQRYRAEDGDIGGSAPGYAITFGYDEYFTVALNGVPHGRISRFLA